LFDHVTIRGSDREASERFYDTVLRTLGVDQSYRTRAFSEWHDFSLTAADAEHPPTRRLHVGFVAPDRARVDDFWRAGTAAGYEDDGPPGPRPEYGADYYGGFLLDPDGNSAEAVHDSRLRRGGIIDHVWIRVSDLGSATAFYDTIARHAGLRKDHDSAERVQFRGADDGSFSLLPGTTPTEHVHMAFPTEDDDAVVRFHESATEAGYRSYGPPGERPQYHPGYYAAYVLDADGHNIELVNHHRPQAVA
jgi:catechol 2,3-dioxygenase-like lactoylglutathione lyase family enzyme